MNFYPDTETDTLIDKLDVLIKAMDASAALTTALRFPMLLPDVHGYDTTGKRHIRVWSQRQSKPYGDTTPIKGQKFACFFVERETGDVRKAAGWRGPALNFVRGNINTPEGRKALTLDHFRDNGWYYAGF